MQCWTFDVCELMDGSVFEEAMARLPWDQRRQKARRFVFQKDRCLSLGAGLLAAYVLPRAGATDLSLGEGPYGKPYLTHCHDVQFSLSHSGWLVACAVSGEPVGVDVEELHEYDADVAKMVFCEAELAWLHDQPDPGQAFTRLWVRKESLLKLGGTGLTDDLRAYDVSPRVLAGPADALPPAVDAPAPSFAGPADAPTPNNGGDVRFWEHTCDGCLLAVCTRGDARVSLHRAEPGFWRVS